MIDANWGIYFAVIVRLMLGVALIITAPGSRFPLVFQIVGWIAIVAGVAAAFIGRERLRRFTNWNGLKIMVFLLIFNEFQKRHQRLEIYVMLRTTYKCLNVMRLRRIVTKLKADIYFSMSPNPKFSSRISRNFWLEAR